MPVFKIYQDSNCAFTFNCKFKISTYYTRNHAKMSRKSGFHLATICGAVHIYRTFKVHFLAKV